LFALNEHTTTHNKTNKTNKNNNAYIST